MIIIAGLIGIVIGLLLNPTKVKIIEKVEEYKETPKGKTQFFESITPKEKFKQAKNITDLL
jgi:hypothetical protein